MNHEKTINAFLKSIKLHFEHSMGFLIKSLLFVKVKTISPSHFMPCI